jgi:hypothetical protein
MYSGYVYVLQTDLSTSTELVRGEYVPVLVLC